MICQMNPAPNPHHDRLPDDFVERCKILRISISRALFLIKCAHSSNPVMNRRGKIGSVPYDPRVLLDEALRIGLGKDALRVIFKGEFTLKEIEDMGYKFPRRSKYPPPPGRGYYSLFQWEPHLKTNVN